MILTKEGMEMECTDDFMHSIFLSEGWENKKVKVEKSAEITDTPKRGRRKKAETE